MSALPADIIRATRAARVVTWIGGVANGRDGLRNIEPGFFEDKADASTVLTSKGALIGVRRRRFVVEVNGEVPIDPTSAIPTVRLIDTDIDVDADCVVTRYEYDMESEMTTLELLG